MRGEFMSMTLDEFIVWLLKQIDSDEHLTKEQEQRLYERIFPSKEAAENDSN